MWERGTLLVVLLLLFAQVDFFLRDGRIPRDPGRYYFQTLWYYWVLEEPAQWPVAAYYAFTTGTGWFHLFLATLARVTGRFPAVIEMLEVGFSLTITGTTALIARRLFDDRVAFFATCLTAAAPVVYLQARFGWVHVPEAALVMLLLERYTADPKLTRTSTVAWVALTGALAVMLRESGLVWVGLMVPLVTWGSRSAQVDTADWSPTQHLLSREGLPLRRLVAVAVAWGFAAAIHLPTLANYLQAKVEAHDRYMLDVMTLGEQMRFMFGSPTHRLIEIGGVLAVGALGLVLVRQGPRAVLARVTGPQWLLLSWGLVPFLLYIVFGTGVDNFNHVAPVLAMLAGLGMARFRWAPLTGIFALAVSFLFSWLPISWVEPLKPIGFETPTGEVKDFRRANNHTFGARTISALLDASCPAPDDWLSCHVVTQHGLYYPTSEELGYFELWQMREDRVELRGVNEKPLVKDGWRGWGVHAMAIWSCPEDTLPWLRRNPDAEIRAAEIANSLGLYQAWATDVGEKCTFHWFTPYGQFQQPRLAPTPVAPTRRWTAESAYSYNWSVIGELGGYREGMVMALLYGGPPQGSNKPRSVVENGVETRVLDAAD